MNIGVSLPSPWLGDLHGVIDAIETLDREGFEFVTTSGHVLTAETGRYAERPSPTYAMTYRDPFVLFAAAAVRTSQIRFRTSILILPMLPTALVAKQAADLSILSRGRFDLGVGISWQHAEYVALGQRLRNRGDRLAEQVQVLRRLWSERCVSFSGDYHEIDRLGVGELPGQSVPIWFGCTAKEGPLRRAAEMADGWIPLAPPMPEDVKRLREYVSSAGRDPSALGIQGRVMVDADVLEQASAQLAAGATDLSLSAPSASAATVDAVLEQLLVARQSLRDAGI